MLLKNRAVNTESPFCDYGTVDTMSHLQVYSIVDSPYSGTFENPKLHTVCAKLRE